MDNQKNQVNQTTSSASSCYTDIASKQITLHSPFFTYELSCDKELRSESWKNELTGESLRFDQGTELEIDLDFSKQRIDIVGWRGLKSQEAKSTPNEEIGYQNNYASYAFDDSNWTGRTSPLPFNLNEPSSVQQENHYHWVRTHVFFPEEAEGESVTFTLGGVGLFNFAYMRVFLNGTEIGVKHQTTRWTDPADFELTPQHPAYRSIRFGRDNVIALQLSKIITRPEELKQIDPNKTRYLPYRNWWPAQFEQYITIRKQVKTNPFRVTSTQQTKSGTEAELEIHLEALDFPITAKLIYRWNSTQPTLHKFVTLSNHSDKACLLLHVRHGQYALNVDVTSGEQGFPVYLHQQFFMSLAHPSGWAIGQQQTVQLKQYPGKWIQPHTDFTCMETVYGVAAETQARPAFLAHVNQRMRRVVRHHDKPYAIFEPFGARKLEETEGPPPFILYATEEFLLDNLKKLENTENIHPSRFDYYCLQFWVNPHGDFTTADPKDFPHNLELVKQEVEKMNMKLGLWIDSSWTQWSIGKNPVAKPSEQFILDYGTEDYVGYCRASEPIHSLYTNGFLHHVRNGVELFKFDNLFAICYNSHHHNHLPGIYSTEAIQSHLIEFLNRLDQENPNVFLMLYWGYRSPWWLLHGDTLFEPGLHLEASHPGPTPTLYVRDSITQGLDQAHWWCKDIPQLGKDSLGVWLSDWPWNSSVGKERWQEGFIMDMFRGGLLAQPWGNTDWLTEPEAKEMAHFIQLLRDHPDCFLNAKLWIGHPWQEEPYGYIASNGSRSFLALFNTTWNDHEFDISIHDVCASSQAEEFEVYRHYPNPVQLHSSSQSAVHFISDVLKFPTRPFELVFLEIVPKEERSYLSFQVKQENWPVPFVNPSQELPIQLHHLPGNQALPVHCEKVHAFQLNQAKSNPQMNVKPLPPKRNWKVTTQVPAKTSGGMFVLTCQLTLGSDSYQPPDVGNYYACEVRINQTLVPHQPVVGIWTLPGAWQAWRVPVSASLEVQTIDLHVTLMSPDEVNYQFHSYWIPNQ